MEFTPFDFCIYTLGFIIVVSTIDDYLYALKSSHNRISKVFSIYTNGKSLLSLETPENSIKCIHGLKTLSMLFIVFHHSFQILFNSIGLSGMPEYVHLKRRSLLMTILATDTFFLVSGFLSVNCFTHKETTIPRYFKILFQRYMRLIPTAAFLMIVLISGSRFKGFDGYMRGQNNDCRNYWWSALLLIQTYYNPNSPCVGPLWFTAVCWHIFIITPVLIKIMKSTSRTIRPVIMMLILIATFIPGYRASYGSLTVLSKYVDTVTRSFPYLVGVFYYYEFFKIKEIRPQIRYPISIIAIIILVSPYYILFSPSVPMDDLTDFFHYLRMVWPFALSWLIHACHNGWGGIINLILSFKYFVPFSNICLGLYIMNDYVAHYISSIVIDHTNGMKYPNDRIIIMYLSTYILASIIAAIMYLIIEVPFAKLGRVLLDSSYCTSVTSGMLNYRKQNSNIDYVIFSKKAKNENEPTA